MAGAIIGVYEFDSVVRGQNNYLISKKEDVDMKRDNKNTLIFLNTWHHFNVY